MFLKTGVNLLSLQSSEKAKKRSRATLGVSFTSIPGEVSFSKQLEEKVYQDSQYEFNKRKSCLTIMS